MITFFSLFENNQAILCGKGSVSAEYPTRWRRDTLYFILLLKYWSVVPTEENCFH